MQGKLEAKHAVGRDRSGSLVAIPKLGRYPHDPFVAGPHQLQSLSEAGDEIVNSPNKGRTAFVAAVEILPSGELTLVIEGHSIAVAWVQASVGSRSQDEVLEAGRSAPDPL